MLSNNQKTFNLIETLSRDSGGVGDNSYISSQENVKFDNSIIEKDNFRNILTEMISKVLWEEIFYIASMTGPSVTTTSASELFSSSTRESDTSSKKYLSPEKISRFRCHFYFNGTDSLDCTAYIGGIGTSTLGTGITSINQTGMEYITLKVTNGVVSLIGKNQFGTTTKTTPYTIIDSTTYTLEIDYFPGERADFFLDSLYIGSITDNLPGEVDVITFMPLLVSLTRGGATNRTLTIVSWEFMQNRK